MRIISLRIGGRNVSRLTINGLNVLLGNASCDALCFTAEEAGSTVKLHKVGSAPDVNLQISTDGSSWKPYTVEDTITLANIGDKVYFKAVGSNERMGNDSWSYNNFVMTGKIAASGNVNSLLEENEETARTMSLAGRNNCYFGMFRECSSLTQAPELPAMELPQDCCKFMFSNCTSLVKSPEIHATILRGYSCSNMFQGCISMVEAPVIHATTVSESCCNNMFGGCTSLLVAHKLPATTLATGCYDYMFDGCTSLTQAPELPATTLFYKCYQYMFRNCTSLEVAPELPATKLASTCYYYMFDGCTSLSSLKVAFTAWGTQTSSWLNNVAATGTFRCPQALIDNTTERGINTVPESWSMVAV